MKILDNIIEYIVLMFLEILEIIIINKFMNIITNIEESAITAYVVFKTFSTVKLEYDKSNGLVVYKSQ